MLTLMLTCKLLAINHCRIFQLPPAPSAPPMAVNHSELTSNSTRLQWGLPPAEHLNGIVRAYVVTVSEQETRRSYNLTSRNLTSRLNELSIRNLHPFYGYDFSVCAVTVSQGPCTQSYSLQTLEDGMCKQGDFMQYLDCMHI